MTSDHPDLVGVAEAARITGLSVRGVRKAHERGKMPSAIPVAGSPTLIWHRRDIEEWARERKLILRRERKASAP